MSTADSAQLVQFADSGTADHLWRLMPDGQVRIENRNSGRVLGVDRMSTVDSTQAVQFAENGTADHLWTFEATATAHPITSGACATMAAAGSGSATAIPGST